MRPGLATTDLLHPDPRQVRAPVRACTPDGCVGGQLCVRAYPALSRDKLSVSQHDLLLFIEMDSSSLATLGT